MRIIGISGKKRSGKNTCANYVSGMILRSQGVVKDFCLDPNGQLLVQEHEQDDWAVLNLDRKDEEFVLFADNLLWPYAKCYSFAEPLKMLGIEYFGLSYGAVFGNEEQRAAPTHLQWENMPGVIVTNHDESEYDELYGSLDAWGQAENIVWKDKSGPMSGREFLQFFGTEIGRKMYPQIWVNKTINNILREQSNIAIITDVRFPDEVRAIQEAGGTVLRLTRCPDGDSHESENALNPDVFDWDGFDFIVDNENKTISETCAEVWRIINC